MISCFYFNTVCAIPVSKRNFVNRHGHGLVRSAKEVKARVDQLKGMSMDSPVMTCYPCGFSNLQALRNGLVAQHHGVHNTPLQLSLPVSEIMSLNDDCESQQKGIAGSWRRYPCRARCMPKDHNSATAYFEIPHDAPHGMSLSCSMTKCRGQSGGPRFRYCQGT